MHSSPRIPLALAIVGWCAAASAQSSAQPWWMEYTPVVSQTTDRDVLQEAHAGVARSTAYFGGWYGFWSLDDMRRHTGADRRWRELGQLGLRRLIYYDSGEVGDYAGFFDAQGQMIYNGWTVPWWKGEPVHARWFGLDAFLSDVDWAPWPTARHYGLPRFTQPDGRLVENLYDVLARRAIDGAWHYDLYSNARITDELARQTGLDQISSRQEAAADVAEKSGWQTVRQLSVDFANPQLRDYRCRELSWLIDTIRPDGVHIDNHGDLNVLYPHASAFGVWSVAHFRQWLRAQFAAAQLRAMGIEDLDTFDIAAYVRQHPLGHGGGYERWRDRRWTEDLIWNCFVTSLVEAGLDFHRAVYRAAKDAAAGAGIACMVEGNVVPAFTGSALMRGACDLTCFEWKVGPFGPVRGSGLPPDGRVAYVTRLGAAIGQTGYCWPSLYVPQHLSGAGHENLHKVLAFDCLANRGLLDYGHAYLDGYSPGTPHSAGFVNRFIRANAARMSRRTYLADVGLVYCPWTEVVATTVDAAAPELFFDEYAGWTWALSRAHRQWDVVLSQDLSADKLARFPVVVLPSILVLTAEQTAELQRYVEQGGHLVATGASGTRRGRADFFVPRESSSLEALADHPRVKRVTATPGRDYWSPEQNPAAVEQMAALLDFPEFTHRLSTNAPERIDIQLSMGPADRPPALSIDLVNHDLDVDTDTLSVAPACEVTIRLPDELAGRPLAVSYVDPNFDSPGDPVPLPAGAVTLAPAGKTLTLQLPEFEYALFVWITPAP